VTRHGGGYRCGIRAALVAAWATRSGAPLTFPRTTMVTRSGVSAGIWRQYRHLRRGCAACGLKSCASSLTRHHSSLVALAGNGAVAGSNAARDEELSYLVSRDGIVAWLSWRTSAARVILSSPRSPNQKAPPCVRGNLRRDLAARGSARQPRRISCGLLYLYRSA